MGTLTLIYLKVGIALFRGVLPLLEEQAKKTPNPLDDAAISALRAFVDAFGSGELDELLKKR